MNAYDILGSDPEYEAYVLEEVRPGDDGWELHFDSGSCIWAPNHTCTVEPKAGESVALFGRGFGFPVRGIVIGNRVYRYETPTEYEQNRAAEQLDAARKKLEAAKAERPERDARIAKLPEPLQARIRRFIQQSDKWSAEFEPYELFVCEQAALFADKLKTTDAIAAFYKLPYDEQRSALPEVSGDHSGNTFGAACHLARCLIDRPDLVPGVHGALCPLVGCEEYGCWAAREGRKP